MQIYQKKIALSDIFSDKDMTLNQIIMQMNQWYTNTIGYEYMHVENTNERLWLQRKIESKSLVTSIDKKKMAVKSIK